MNISDLVTKELHPGEIVRWTGSGDPGVLFTRADFLLVPFSLLWGGFAIFWETQAVTENSGPLFLVFGGAFVLVGLYLIVGRFFTKAYRKRTTAYAVTDRRAFLTDGRRVVETGLAVADRTTTWAQDRRHVSVVWNNNRQGTRNFFNSRRAPWPGNTGTDGIGSPMLMAFYDVQDGDALLAALNESQRTERR
ncbi:hypothetical protein [Subtercola endophyticus]|uniref:hypothetical protein n=1 Tax=Subtercola endophyticus TaxID=2895559 RepID=UPI001E44C332|nr:hypothetical protein [Subtercola endophyticus]UFS59541.1 hypothetical protein LQ955_01695 [Subtercola endophyticus]